MKNICFLLCILFIPGSVIIGQSLSDITADMEKYEGFFDYYWDDENGKIWLEIDKLEEEFIYVNSLAAGVGSNDIGLDRSQLGNTRIVHFSKIGPKVLMIQPNYDFRASSDNELEKKSVDEAFAQSVLWGFEVTAEENGAFLVDITDFLVRDAHDVTGRLRTMNEGNYSLDNSRSAIYLPGSFNFPKNSEFEAILTFAGTDPGSHLSSVTPTPEALTVRQHHSFIQLPDDGYTPENSIRDPDFFRFHTRITVHRSAKNLPSDILFVTGWKKRIPMPRSVKQLNPSFSTLTMEHQNLYELHFWTVPVGGRKHSKTPGTKTPFR
jgi:hypothetical protein